VSIVMCESREIQIVYIVQLNFHLTEHVHWLHTRGFVCSSKTLPPGQLLTCAVSRTLIKFPGKVIEIVSQFCLDSIMTGTKITTVFYFED